MSFLKKILGQENPENNYQPKITIEKVQHVFEYGKLNDLVGIGDENLKDLKVGRLMSWEAKPYYYAGYKNIPAQNVPANIKWSNNPIFCYVSIADKSVQYHWSEEGGSAVYICPTTTNTEHIKIIDKIFEYYYLEVFKLPDSLKKIKTAKRKANITDKISFLSEYLKTNDSDFFTENFCDNSEIYDIAIWIDWREEDENIITYCEDILQTGQLFVETIDTDNDRGFDTKITYKDKQISILYKDNGADRDTTIKALNHAIRSEFEMRLCKESWGSDTLCFVPLTNEEWGELDKEYPKQMNEKFEKITAETKLFD